MNGGEGGRLPSQAQGNSGKLDSGDGGVPATGEPSSTGLDSIPEFHLNIDWLNAMCAGQHPYSRCAAQMMKKSADPPLQRMHPYRDPGLPGKTCYITQQHWAYRF